MPPAGTRRADTLEVAVIVTLAVALGPLATDLYLPSLPAIGRAFDRPVADTQLTLSVFLAGFALSQLIYGPLADRFGRKPVMLTGLAIFLAASIFCALAWSLEALLVGRLLQALGICAGPVLGRAVVRDAWGADRSARILSYTGSAMAIAPAVGPIIGGVLEAAFGWRASFLALSLFAFGLLTLVLLRLPETNRQPDPTALQPGRMLANFILLLRHRSYLGYALITALGYAGLFAFISGSSFLLIDSLGLSPLNYGFSFAAVIVGYITGAFVSGRYGGRIGGERMIVLGVGLSLLAALLGMALALSGVLNLWSVIGATTCFFLASGLMLPNAVAGALRHYPHMAGAASSLMGFIQMSIAAILGIAVGQAHDGSHLPMASAILFCALGILLSWSVLVRPGLRQDQLARAA
ncbi:MAG: Bcr/CflA family multidrug efflux MFS transporter [Rhodospirillales bacterium]